MALVDARQPHYIYTFIKNINDMIYLSFVTNLKLALDMSLARTRG